MVASLLVDEGRLGLQNIRQVPVHRLVDRISHCHCLVGQVVRFDLQLVGSELLTGPLHGLLGAVPLRWLLGRLALRCLILRGLALSGLVLRA